MLKVSLIVCTRGRPRLLERLLRGVALLDYPAFELIIICDPGDTETFGCVARHAGDAKIGHCAVANLAKARNVGLSMALGDIAAFIDDDAVPEPDWLSRLAACYARPEVTASGGFIRARNAAKFQTRFVLADPFGKDHQATRLPAALPKGWFVTLTGTNFSVRRATALALGGFDENYSYYLEETDFLFRLNQAGGKIAVDPHAQVYHGYAASDLRAENGAPKSLYVIARSKAYFCHINRRPETSLAAINRALARFVVRKAWLVLSNLLLARLSTRDAARLFGELRTGMREGERLARAGRSMACFPPAPAFKWFRQAPDSLHASNLPK